MIITSDNTATDLVLARVGGVAALNAWFDRSGYPSLRMNATIGDYFRDYMAAFDPSARQLSTSDVWDAMNGPAIGGTKSPAAAAVSKRLGEISPAKSLEIARQFYRDRGRWLGSITANEMGTFVEAIETARLVSPAHSKELIRIMTWQQSGARRIPHYIEDWYDVAHKTGDGPPSVANDVGVVYLDSGPVVVVILANDIRGNYGEAEDAEGRLAQRIAQLFDGPR